MNLQVARSYQSSGLVFPGLIIASHKPGKQWTFEGKLRASDGLGRLASRCLVPDQFGNLCVQEFVQVWDLRAMAALLG